MRYFCITVLVGEVDVRFITMRFAGTRVQIIRQYDFRNTAKEDKGALVGADPLFQPLRPGSLSVGVVGGPQHGNDDLGFTDLTDVLIYNRCRMIGIFHKQVVNGTVTPLNCSQITTTTFAINTFSRR